MQPLYRYILLIIFSSIFFTACSRQQQVTVQFTSAKQLNKDSNGINKPIPIHIYELTRAFPFKNIAYQQLASNSELALGESLIDYQYFELKPNNQHKISIRLDPMTHYLGVIAGYHNLSKHHWKILAYLNPNKSHITIKYYVEDNNIYRFSRS
jgi:type VI secretion system VasD/TssJ family lipoprotein